MNSKLLEDAKSFHGHLGPFIVLGLRIGLIGLHELNMSKHSDELKVIAYLNYKPPISCILDGLQITTGCTLGNKKLEFNESDEVLINFIVKGKNVLSIKVDNAMIDKLLKKPMKSIEEMEKLAYEVAKIPQKELFNIAKH